MHLACDYCKEFYLCKEGPAHRARYQFHFCGAVCRGRWNAEGLNPANPPRPKINCPTCGNVFAATADARKRRRFCSKGCRAADGSTRRSRSWMAPCDHCGLRIRCPPWRVKCGRRIFCSRACASLGHRGVLAGEKNGRYVHGRCLETYPREFNWWLRAKVRRRDGCCRICKVSCDEYREVRGVKMPIHHIDSDKMNNAMSNLICLCANCHARTHGSEANRKKWQQVFAEMLSSPSSDVGKLA